MFLNFCFQLIIYSYFFRKLGEKYGIQGIPALVVIKKDGTIVTENGRGDVEKKGVNAFKDWSK